MLFKYLIIGGGVAGVTAAETIRVKESEAVIAVANDEPYALYSRVMLSKPNFFLGKIPFDKVYIKGTKWYEDNHVTFLGGKKATGIDSKNKAVSFADGSSIGYEKLLIATGVCARHWNVPGAEKKGIFYLRTLDDGKAIMEAVKTKKHALTIGGGFISFEMADMLKMAGLEVTSVILENYFWEPILDEASGKMLEAAMEKGGVKILRKAEVAEVLGSNEITGVRLKDGTEIPCDMVVCGIGASAELQCFKNSGLCVNRGIVTNEFLETSLEDVWAAGDAVEYKDVLLEETVQMGNWASAHEQGRVAGMNMMASFDSFDKTQDKKLGTGKTPFKFVSFYTTSGFGINVAFVGDVRPSTSPTSNTSRTSKNRTVIPRGSPQENSYGRLIVDEKGELVGATLINRIAEMSTISKLIEQNVKVAARQKELADMNFDLKELIG